MCRTRPTLQSSNTYRRMLRAMASLHTGSLNAVNGLRLWVVWLSLRRRRRRRARGRHGRFDSKIFESTNPFRIESNRISKFRRSLQLICIPCGMAVFRFYGSVHSILLLQRVFRVLGVVTSLYRSLYSTAPDKYFSIPSISIKVNAVIIKLANNEQTRPCGGVWVIDVLRFCAKEQTTT